MGLKKSHWVVGCLVSILALFSVSDRLQADPPTGYETRSGDCFTTSGQLNQEICQYFGQTLLGQDRWMSDDRAMAIETHLAFPMGYMSQIGDQSEWLYSGPEFEINPNLFKVPWWYFVEGTDLGLSVYNASEDMTIYFFGDTWPTFHKALEYIDGTELLGKVSSDTTPVEIAGFRSGAHYGTPIAVDWGLISEPFFYEWDYGFSIDAIRSVPATMNLGSAYWSEEWLSPGVHSTAEEADRGAYQSLTEWMAFDESEEPTGFLNENELCCMYGYGDDCDIPDPDLVLFDTAVAGSTHCFGYSLDNAIEYFSTLQPDRSELDGPGERGYVRAEELAFFAPTGAGIADDGDIYVWHGKYTNWYCDQSHLARIPQETLGSETARPIYIGLFSEQKFGAVNPVLIDQSTHPESTDGGVCEIPWEASSGEKGFLIFGAGMDQPNWVDIDGASDPGDPLYGWVPNEFSDVSPMGWCAALPKKSDTGLQIDEDRTIIYPALPNFLRKSSYRRSDLYLAYVPIIHIDDSSDGESLNGYTHDLRPNIYYYVGPTSNPLPTDCNGEESELGRASENECWCKGNEEYAQPIISAGPNSSDIRNREFGEFSVKRVPANTSIENDNQYIMLINCTIEKQISSHIGEVLATSLIDAELHSKSFGGGGDIEMPSGCELHVRAANIANPWTWTEPKKVPNNYGYGNYLIDSSMKRESFGDFDDLLWFSRAVSTWRIVDHQGDGQNYGASIFHAVLNFKDFSEELTQ